MSTTIPETLFKLNEQVVYPLQGVGSIISIDQRLFKDKQIWYYTIYFEISDMTTMVPVDKAVELGIRAIVPREEAEKALILVGESYEAAPADWKLRYQINHDLLKQGSVIDIATVVRTLYHRSKVKELPVMERKLYDSAIKLLVDEVSLSLGLPKKEVETLIFNKLERDIPSDSKKSADDEFGGFDDDEGLMDERDDVGGGAAAKDDDDDDEDDSDD